jgi:hypothetical protein
MWEILKRLQKLYVTLLVDNPLLNASGHGLVEGARGLRVRSDNAGDWGFSP